MRFSLLSPGSSTLLHSLATQIGQSDVAISSNIPISLNVTITGTATIEVLASSDSGQTWVVSTSLNASNTVNLEPNILYTTAITSISSGSTVTTLAQATTALSNSASLLSSSPTGSATAASMDLYTSDVISDFLASGIIPSYSSSSLSITVADGSLYVSGKRVSIKGAAPYTCAANATTYVYIDQTGNITYNTTGIDPSVGNDELVFSVTTNSTGVTGLTQYLSSTLTFIPNISTQGDLTPYSFNQNTPGSLAVYDNTGGCVLSGIIGTVPSTASLTMTLPNGIFYTPSAGVNPGNRCNTANFSNVASMTHTYATNTTTYVDAAVGSGGAPIFYYTTAPSPFLGRVRTQSVTTNGTQIISVTAIATSDRVFTKGVQAATFNTLPLNAVAISGLNTWVLGDLGTKQAIHEGTNAAMGEAVLVAGTVTVSNTLVTANSRIFLTNNVPGGTVGTPYISARVAGTSFTITSTSSTDTSSIAWEIKEPN